MTDDENVLARIDTSRPHTARIWNYWTGGKDNYSVDREAGDQIRQLHPGIGDYALADRLFLGRSVHHLAADVGIRQFLDIGTGLPSADNTHEVAQRATPDARIVYVDNDPLVLAHARALLTSTPEGRTDYLDADLRDVDTILERAAGTLDFTQPVALMLLGVVIFVEDDEESYGIVRRLMDALPVGSHLVLSHTITSPAMPDVDAAVAFWNEHGTPRLTQRTPQQLTRYFDGLDLLEPGVVSCSRWRPQVADGEVPDEVAMFGGVGRKAEQKAADQA
ncbi:SAM-dependent methyltransferase [Streptomyces lunaelactis]|uniref:SAM-dependent methyltransferase n=1 Tax=Streptomyces lunaelactis TaxID=1535768 RepID=UPI0015853B72|nr:SAM-dependent methyltransferase [Streptomyces lunaelactis]NUK05519.1 SAM-dependent methyltransferase [Streptomyces lunaelactis]NUK12410.1 SAM-dependent methyltransferase [Streptomyces lunaelactis]NUK20929.1 SAM-dependent methyltransferase [Streptomyces lunaelactis]NUK27631.1 SAM-dependent methyltransferase [Streptomyces lunaelactis]NUK38732.1 SAM-dependent methyltransferase [Streptomyces lunaelactis]